MIGGAVIVLASRDFKSPSKASLMERAGLDVAKTQRSIERRHEQAAFATILPELYQPMPQPYEFDPGHADGIRHADLDAGERVLNEVIYECQRSLEGIGHARLDLEARSWARAQGLRD